MKMLMPASLFFLCLPAFAQNNYSIRYFDEAQGLTSNFTEGVSQDYSGHLIIAHKSGIDRFDGRSFVNLRTDSSGLGHATCLYKAEDETWIGFFDGHIAVGSKDGIKHIDTSIKGQIKYLHKDSQDGIWAFSKSGQVFWATASDTSRFDISEKDLIINSVVAYKRKEFIIGTNDAVFLVRFEQGKDVQFLQQIAGLPSTKITSLHFDTEQNELWAGTEDDGLYRITSPFSEGQIAQKFLLNSGRSIDNVQCIFTDDEERMWFGTADLGLIKLVFHGKSRNKFVAEHFFDTPGETYLIRDIFEDAEGNIWIATLGRGLFQIVEKIFQHPFDDAWLHEQSITQLFRDSKDNVWLGIDKGIFRTSEYLSTSKFTYFYIGGNRVTAIAEDRYGSIWMGTASRGMFRLAKGSPSFVHITMGNDNLANAINSLEVADDGIWISTKSGLFQLSFKGALKKHFSTLQGLPHNNVKFCFVDSLGRIWTANEGNRVSYIENGKVNFLESSSDQTIIGVDHILQDHKGRLWFATLGQGIFIFNGGTVSNITEKDGLPSNYCYQMVLDDAGNVWVSHQKSISQISSGLKVVNVIGQNSISALENSMITFLFKDMQGNIWISFTHGVVKFNPAIDKMSKIPPQLTIGSMKVSDKHQRMVNDLELPYKKYKIDFELAGISLRNPDHIRYKYQLQGYTDDWSEAQTSNVVGFPRLENGSYTLRVIASKNGGEWTSEPTTYSFSIDSPFWRNWLFFVIVALALGGMVFGFIRYRTYRFLVDKAELERIVNERTIEIQEQKTEIEHSRDEISKYAKDITDSIKYAKRIQDAIFPVLEEVQKMLPESFVFFQSKDLVSGDFYFAKQVGSIRIFSAIDCTGHGVPGGFMSIVASNLLQQAIGQADLTKPSEILEYLNQGVTRTLHQTYEESNVKDGMDIALCAWDEKTGIVQFAGAYNPLYLFRDGKLIEYKGNRFPIGTFVGEKIRKFTNHEIKVKKGDMLYIFSDGFADQFGGPYDQKFKVHRFKAMLQEVHTQPVSEQLGLVRRRLNNWKGDREQIDDIVLMGIRIT